MSEIGQIKTKDLLNVSINFGNDDHAITFSGYEYILKESELRQLCEQNNKSNNDVANKNKNIKCEFSVKIAVDSQKI